MDEQREYPFEFSVVMAVYNVEPFLREAVDSLIQQDFGFERIQLIMVDDGSTDGSGAICDEYAAQYPENVMVIHKENGGVSSARNEGLKHIQGRYVTFLDPDDKLSDNTMRTVFNFFIENEQYVDLVAIPIYFFDAVSGAHSLNYKFNKGTRVINLTAAHKMMHMSISASFIRHEVAEKLKFDVRLAIAEDAKEVIRILLEKQALGVVSECMYFYRRRSAGQASAIQGATQNKKYYIDTLRYFTMETCDNCLKKMGYIPNFVQYSVFSDFQWKIRTEHLPRNVLDPDELAEYFELLKKCVKYFDDAIIMSLPGLSKEYINFILSLKYDAPPQKAMLPDNILYHYKNCNVSYLSDLYTYIDFIKIEDGVLEIEGYTTAPGPDGETKIDIGMTVNGMWEKCELVDREAGRLAVDKPLIAAFPFKFRKKLKKENIEICVSCAVGDVHVKKTQLIFGKFSPIGKEYANSYYSAEGYSVTFSEDTFCVKKCSRWRRVLLEVHLLWELLRSPQKSNKKAFCARLLRNLLKPLCRKQIWLISDRASEAGDNGEAFFEYIVKHHAKEVWPIFTINCNTKDYGRLKRTGHVIPYLSWRHKFVYLLSTTVVSSQADDNAFNPFFAFFKPYRNIIAEKYYVFLQHGIIKDDLSDWLSRYKQNLALFVTSTNEERDSILSCPYYYSKDQILLSGLPRYDLLYNKRQKIVSILPTWRANLVMGTEPETGLRKVRPDFEKSTYFSMYSEFSFRLPPRSG